jgi:hypothetical protein
MLSDLHADGSPINSVAEGSIPFKANSASNLNDLAKDICA